MDVQMPVMNGYESTSQIREFEDTEGIVPGTYIIGLSGEESMDHDRKCRHVKMNENLLKPLDRKQFEQILSIFNHY
jgi:CheY-like chemotaxis protein